MILTDAEKLIAENLSITTVLALLAWEAGELSEGVASEQIGLDRVSARERKKVAIKVGTALATGEMMIVVSSFRFPHTD